MWLYSNLSLHQIIPDYKRDEKPWVAQLALIFNLFLGMNKATVYDGRKPTVFTTWIIFDWFPGFELINYLYLWYKNSHCKPLRRNKTTLLPKDAMPKIVFNEAIGEGIEREGLEVIEQESNGHSF